mmetsp:Transcript_3127/g.3515  ORF Transcript_3127/g.3515 Transcript_3127/m.3515 type:complete len:602 (-) Transcript_3127:67-1872(-)
MKFFPATTTRTRTSKRTKNGVFLTLVLTASMLLSSILVVHASQAGGVKAPPPNSMSSSTTTSTTTVPPPSFSSSTTSTSPATSTPAAATASSTIPATIKGIDEETWASTLVDFPRKTLFGIRHHLNLKGILGSPTRPTNSCEVYSGYDKISSSPVFQVTTAWGSAYMNMEKLTMEDTEYDRRSGSGDDDPANQKSLLATSRNADTVEALGDEDNQFRTISLYYLDPNDALAAHAEFKQMEGMTQSDVRVTAVSLGKALRSAANSGRGLVTGQPVDLFTGKVLGPKEGGSLRHKLMPPKKQLYYAAQCLGKERIGFFSKRVLKNNPNKGDRDSDYDHAIATVMGNSALTYRGYQRRQALIDKKIDFVGAKNIYEQQYAHMDGQLGIPVFYMDGLERHNNRVKSLISGSSRIEKPFFFNYEDLQAAWAEKTKKPHDYKYPKDTNSNNDEEEEATKSSNYFSKETSATSDANGVELSDEEVQKLLPPHSVEVFNLWDVVTSMEREHFKRENEKQQTSSPHQQLWKNLLYPFQNRIHNAFTPNDAKYHNNNINNPLDSIVFIPSSEAVEYKESMTTKGNSEARLRPMRDAMSPRRCGNGSLFSVL